MGFLEDLFGQLGGRPRPAAPIDVFGSGGLDAYGDLMGDGSDALQPITPFSATGGFSGGLGSMTSSPSGFWQMPQLGGDSGGYGQSAYLFKGNTLPSSSKRVFGQKVQPTEPVVTPTKRVFGQKTQQATSSGPTDTYNLPNVSANVTRWYPLAKKYADQEGVPVEAIMAIIQNESGGQPGARSGINPGDQGRAVGLMQLIPKYHGQDGADLTDPEINIQRGVRYFAQAYKKRGNDLNKAMAEYFGGGGAFDAAGNIRPDVGDINITIGKYLPRFQATTQAYKTWLDRQTQAEPPPGAAAVVAPAAATPQAAQGLQAAAIAEATKHIGTPYLLASQANNPQAGAFDCSGLIQWAFGQAGRTLPRVAQGQYEATARITANEAQPGDLVFFTGTYDSGSPVSHVGIYLGGNKMLQAGSGGVGYADLSSPYWRSKLYGWGRVR